MLIYWTNFVSSRVNRLARTSQLTLTLNLSLNRMIGGEIFIIRRLVSEIMREKVNKVMPRRVESARLVIVGLMRSNFGHG